MNKLVRITTVPLSLEKLLENQLKFISRYFNTTAISSDKSRLERIGLKEGVSTYAVEMTRKITPGSDLKAVWQLYRFFKTDKPLIVHSHTPKAGTLGMIAAKLANVPIRLHTVAGLPLLESVGLKRKLLNVVERLTYSCATTVYPNSRGLEQIIIEEGFCNKGKLKVLANGSSNGINTAFFDPALISSDFQHSLRKNLAIDVNDKVFVFVGRLVGDKGVNETVLAFKMLSSKFSALKLVLVGPYEAELDPLQAGVIDEINMNPNILSIGYQNDVRPYLAISDGLIFPSYREGFPNVVMQAGAMGLPSIVSDINGCNEIIVDGENGIIIPPKDVDALYKAIEKFITEKDLLKRLKSNARRMIVERYEQQVVWDAILAEYKRLEKDVQKRN